LAFIDLPIFSLLSTGIIATLFYLFIYLTEAQDVFLAQKWIDSFKKSGKFYGNSKRPWIFDQKSLTLLDYLP
jgi:hypothetical protein